MAKDSRKTISATSTKTQGPLPPFLKPCPFCGERTIYLNNVHLGRRASINCPSCLASIPNECNDIEELINCWNARASI